MFSYISLNSLFFYFQLIDLKLPFSFQLHILFPAEHAYQRHQYDYVFYL